LSRAGDGVGMTALGASTDLTPAQLQARAKGRRRLEEMRRRAHRIRVWVSCVAVAVFVAMFSTIYIQMAENADPALASATTKTATSSTTQSAATRRAAAASAAAATASASTSSPAPVTTQQS
jgi:hypothetical protein